MNRGLVSDSAFEDPRRAIVYVAFEGESLPELPSSLRGAGAVDLVQLDLAEDFRTRV